LEDGFRIAIVGAGGHGRITLDVLLAAGYEEWIVGFYDDSWATLPRSIRGFPVLGDVGILKSMLSVESIYVVVAITDNADRLRVANSIRLLGGEFATAIHPDSYVSSGATVGDGSVITAGVVLHPDASLGSHCCVGPSAVIDRDAVLSAGVWVSAGAIVGPGARVEARVVVGQNASVGRKSVVRQGIGDLQAVEEGYGA